MTHPEVNSEQVAALFTERQRYETWLSTLESKRATTPPHIYHRVHADYTARLQRVIEQLATHRAVLQQLESDLATRLTAIDIEEAKHRDEAAEAELRASVGELTAEHHRDVAERAEAALAVLGDERMRVIDELARLRAVLEAGGIATTATKARAAGVAGAAAAPSENGARHPAPAPPGAAAPAGTSPADWDLSFERTPEPKAPAPPPRRVPAELTPEAPTGGGPFDDLEFLKTMIDPRSSGESVAVGSGVGAGGGRHAAALGGGADSAIPPAGSGSLGTDPARGQASVPVSAPSGSQPAITRDTGEMVTPKEGAEQVKTLKCQECGTLNYPTEWYCERCGAELAAL
jgi:hypothetical protein